MQAQAWSYWPIALVVAPFIGSFLGVVIQRLPKAQPVVFGRSSCDACGVPLTPCELVPLASFIWLRGRCRSCGEAIDRFHPAVELAAIGVALSAVLLNRDSPYLWVDCLLGWVLLVLAWIDWRWMLLPDILTLPLLLAGLLFTLATAPAAITDHAAGAAAGYLALRGLGWCYRIIRGRDGIGVGDAKLLGAIGAWLGLSLLPQVVLLAAVLALIAAALLAVIGRRMRADTALPFGPYLALAFWVLWLHSNSLFDRAGMS